MIFLQTKYSFFYVLTFRMNLYDESCPLNKVAIEMDSLINTVLWIEKHCVASEEIDSSSDSD